jgi:hypothetical protein
MLKMDQVHVLRHKVLKGAEHPAGRAGTWVKPQHGSQVSGSARAAEKSSASA